MERPLMVEPRNCESRILMEDNLLHFVLIPIFWEAFQIARHNYCVLWLFSPGGPNWSLRRNWERNLPEAIAFSGSYHSLCTWW